jgi:hypothetical protein
MNERVAHAAVACFCLVSPSCLPPRPLPTPAPPSQSKARASQPHELIIHAKYPTACTLTGSKGSRRCQNNHTEILNKARRRRKRRWSLRRHRFALLGEVGGRAFSVKCYKICSCERCNRHHSYHNCQGLQVISWEAAVF